MRTRKIWGPFFAALLFVSSAAYGQDKPAAVSSRQTGYDLNHESTIVGTVVSFTPASQTPPLGAHVVLQTSSGTLDVHVGDARFLKASNFTIETGDTLRIIGETVAYGKGTQFVARIVQKGTQALAVRSIRGIPLSYAAPKTDSNNKQGGVL
jgi:DNA/RNA endonuclease YhcR with UshA esterase domain